MPVPGRLASGLRGNPAHWVRSCRRPGYSCECSIFREAVILTSADFSGEKFLYSGFCCVYGIELHVQMLCGGRTTETLDRDQLKCVPRLCSHSPLNSQHAGSEEFNLLEPIKFLFKVCDLVFSAEVTFGKFRAGEILFVVLRFTKTSPRDGPKPGPETAAARVLEAVDFGNHNQQCFVCQIVSVGRLKSLPPRPLT